MKSVSASLEAGPGNNMAAIPASGITPNIPPNALDLAQAAKQPLRMADMNIDASNSDQAITESLLQKISAKKGSVGKRKASGVRREIQLLLADLSTSPFRR